MPGDRDVRNEDEPMWQWMAFHSAVATASWLTWPLVVANVPVTWMRLWAPLVLPPVRPPKAR